MIGIFIYPGFQLLDATGPASVFDLARRETATVPELRMLATRAGSVRSSCGVEVVAHDLSDASGLSILVMAGGDAMTTVMRCRVTQALFRDRARCGAQVASVCTGAYLLASAGLLDGHTATTHWSVAEDFRFRFPRVVLEPDRIYCRQANLWTSAGVTAGIDLALAMVSDGFGEDTAKRVARQLVLYRRRSGAQPQASSALELSSPAGRFGPLLTWVHEHLDQPLSVDALASRAGLSARHFARAFKRETGRTPAGAVERLRLEVAREQVETSGRSLSTIARTTGFGDAERMRRAFVRAFGRSPQALRRTFPGA